MAPISSEDQLSFAVACLKNVGVKPDFNVIAEECGIISKAAAAKRYERLLKSNFTTAGVDGSPKVPKTPSTPKTSSKKEEDDESKIRSKKRQVDTAKEDRNIAKDDDDDDDEVESPSKKPKTSKAAPAKFKDEEA